MEKKKSTRVTQGEEELEERKEGRERRGKERQTSLRLRGAAKRNLQIENTRLTSHH